MVCKVEGGDFVKRLGDFHSLSGGGFIYICNVAHGYASEGVVVLPMEHRGKKHGSI